MATKWQSTASQVQHVGQGPIKFISRNMNQYVGQQRTTWQYVLFQIKDTQPFVAVCLNSFSFPRCVGTVPGHLSQCRCELTQQSFVSNHGVKPSKSIIGVVLKIVFVENEVVWYLAHDWDQLYTNETKNWLLTTMLVSSRRLNESLFITQLVIVQEQLYVLVKEAEVSKVLIPLHFSFFAVRAKFYESNFLGTQLCHNEIETKKVIVICLLCKKFICTFGPCFRGQGPSRLIDDQK